MAIPMILQSGDHAVTLSYDVTKKKWFFIDADQLPSKEFDVENYAALVDIIINAFSKNNYAGFKTEIYINKSQDKFFSNVVQNDKWQVLHTNAIKKEVTDSAGHSLLFLSSRLGHTDIVESLLKKEENPNRGRFDKVTHLYVAAQNGHIDIVKILLNKNADPNLAREDGTTPLFMATQMG